MDDPEYCSKAQITMIQFSEFGLFEGHDVITTFEGSSNPLNTKYVDRLIERFLK